LVSHIEGAAEVDGVYGNIIFDLHPLSQKQPECKERATHILINFMSLLSLVCVLKFNATGIADILELVWIVNKRKLIPSFKRIFNFAGSHYTFRIRPGR